MKVYWEIFTKWLLLFILWCDVCDEVIWIYFLSCYVGWRRRYCNLERDIISRLMFGLLELRHWSWLMVMRLSQNILPWRYVYQYRAHDIHTGEVSEWLTVFILFFMYRFFSWLSRMPLQDSIMIVTENSPRYDCSSA